MVNDEDDWPPSIWMDDLDEWRPHSVARQLDFGNEEIDYDSEIEYEPGEIEVNTNSNTTKLSEVVEKLKDLQMFLALDPTENTFEKFHRKKEFNMIILEKSLLQVINNIKDKNLKFSLGIVFSTCFFPHIYA